MTSDAIAIISAGVALVAAAGAWAAVLVNRWNAKDTIRAQVNIAARSSRATVVSANRQKWIDAIREDVADFIAIRAQMRLLDGHGSMEIAGQDRMLAEARELRDKATMLRARVEMRLNHDEDDHLTLLAAMDRFDQELTQETDAALRLAARRIFKAEWTRLKKEASGIDPFVREAVPPRT